MNYSQFSMFQRFMEMDIAMGAVARDTSGSAGEGRFSPAAPNQHTNPMGDRSPKSNQKQATQKQAKADVVNQKKQAVITAQQATKAKAAAAKKK